MKTGDLVAGGMNVFAGSADVPRSARGTRYRRAVSLAREDRYAPAAMRRTLRDAGLAAALLLARSAMGASVTLIEGLPANLAIDGDVGEWTAPPFSDSRRGGPGRRSREAVLHSGPCCQGLDRDRR